ncbi:MAG TPA: cyclic nucleotide-binding domain-containing protein [Thermohalobaculum sp.]|nr:cyclic nucleotide-binding domain-containing protein [Thermohalobaculum sp.]
MQRVTFEKGQTLFSEGEPGDLCYKILSGKIDILLNDPDRPGLEHARKIAVCGEGEIIGEMGVIENVPRSATAVAAEQTVCKSFDASEIIGLLTDEPHEALAYVRVLIRRVRAANSRVFFPASRDE